MARFACCLAAAFLLAIGTPGFAEEPVPSAADGKPVATHKQVRRIQPMHNGQSIHLNTYCLAPNGDILACVGGQNQIYKQDANGGYTVENVDAKSLVQVYSPDGDLKAEWPLEFKATAINVAKDQTVFVAGEGKVGRLSLKGELLGTANAPSLGGDPGKAREAAIKKARELLDQSVETFRQQMKFAQEQTAKIEQTPEEDRTPSQKARLKAYAKQIATYEQQIEILEQQDVEQFATQTAASPTTITALAVTDEHVFVCANSTTGGGYDVWRCDYDFQNAAEVLSGLRGCCGQMDIQALADRIVVAENTKFQVAIHDEEGKRLSAFGSRDRSSPEGFGSCCNPMNVRCCPNGEIITAESSIGDIKRFTADGKFASYVGRAKVSGGCKHVAVGWDEQRDRYYMMNVTDNSICVLVPRSEAPEFTEDELAAKAAAEGLGRKLTGGWQIPGAKASKPKSTLGSALESLFGGGGETATNSNAPFEHITLNEEGKAILVGGMYGQWGINNWTWQAVRQDEKQQTVDVDLYSDDIQYLSLRAQFTGEDAASFSILSQGQSLMTTNLVRAGAEAKPVPVDPPAAPQPEPSDAAIDASVKVDEEPAAAVEPE